MLTITNIDATLAYELFEHAVHEILTEDNQLIFIIEPGLAVQNIQGEGWQMLSFSNEGELPK